ncbi:LPP20 family lipoprotein [Seleniivibrio woodruffii]|uniref:LPP20 lipoprotein n=1 Tax=Seleniivibrio woodruffii TaxID=1078050 RepID=A0A4R1K963_9BACT|nr:LPP20 family lipoprotein [Seleniivibrio woodruffii]TCK60884.1 LPP20 lipoprotein [Seleniivibrio woodruffii]TVZ36514.1 LPP20 lipoprotein [Seleniivibrio woodruffii]
MKKLILLMSVLAFALVGCGDKPQPPQKLADPCFVGAPSWVLMPNVEGTIAAVGSAAKSAAGMQFTRDSAMANARSELARMIDVKVNTMMKDFTQVTGVGDAQTVDKVTSSVSKQIASQSLQGSTQKDIWMSPCGEMYVLVVLDAKKVADLTKQQVTSSLKNDAALWQQFQAQKAQDELDAAINKEFAK